MTSKYTAKNNFENMASSGNIATRGCNAITFINQGDVVCFINGNLRLLPGESFTIAQVQPEVEDQTEYQISFRLAHPETTGTDQNCVFVTTFLKEIITSNGTTSVQTCTR